MENRMKKLENFFSNEGRFKLLKAYDTQVSFFIVTTQVTSSPSDIPFSDIVKLHNDLRSLIREHDLTEGNYEVKVMTENWTDENGCILIRFFDKDALHCK